MNIEEAKGRVWEKYKDVEIKTQELNGGGSIAILRGGLGEQNPKAYMDDVVSEFVQNEMYNEFIESFLDNPWVRIITFDFNNIRWDGKNN